MSKEKHFYKTCKIKVLSKVKKKIFPVTSHTVFCLKHTSPNSVSKQIHPYLLSEITVKGELLIMGNFPFISQSSTNL